eukprot:2852812-Ditylum_brightwellii.AAC.1
MKEKNAAYMHCYRAKKKAEHFQTYMYTKGPIEAEMAADLLLKMAADGMAKAASVLVSLQHHQGPTFFQCYHIATITQKDHSQ